MKGRPTVKRSFRAATVFTAATACAIALAPAAEAAPATHGAAATTASPSTAPRDALGNFASQIETLGVTRYPNSFTEAALTADGTTDVYIVTPADRSFIRAVASLNRGNYPVRFIGTRRSYAQLDELNVQVAADTAKLIGEGVNIADSYPDPSTGTVVIDIKHPDKASISRLASAQGNSAAPATYLADAASALQAILGHGVTLGNEVNYHAVQEGRNDDTAPFFGGDALQLPDGQCTGGFNVRNSHGSPFMLSAGHCGNGTVTNLSGTVGTVSSNWYGPNSGYDVEAIAVSSAVGRVWLNNTAVAAVGGALIPAVGTQITFNGWNTGRKTVTVNMVDFNVMAEDHLGRFSYTAAHQILGGSGVAGV